MTTAAAPVARHRSLTIATWVGRILLALVFLNAGAAKLFGEPVMVTMFDLIGAGQWLRYLVGALEVAGATVTNLTALDAPPWSPLALLVLAALVVWAGRRLPRRSPRRALRSEA